MSTSTTTNNSRKRQRAVEVTPREPEVPPQLKELARTHFIENKKMNTAKGISDKARKSLLGGMQTANLTGFKFETSNEGGEKIALDVEITTPDVQFVDIAKLAKTVNMETLLRVVSATQAAVKEICGDIVLQQVLVAGKGTTNVKVSAAK